MVLNIFSFVFIIYKHENMFILILRQAGELLRTLESTDGLQWKNLWNRIDTNDPQTMGLYWLMFLVDIFIYAFMMYYVDTIKPGKYGVGRKWYFPFEVNFAWRKISHFP